ncbi:MAG: hypothetical protein P4L28_07610 [Paludibacteraceae bacterium]|nr:hypothetical protein [Paludibacteraceae bacterium]
MKQYKKNSIGKITYGILYVAFIFIINIQVYAENEATVVPYESFNVNINFDKIGYKNFQALYEDPAGLFLPVNDVFTYLKIPITVNEDGSLMQGFFNQEKNTYIINYSERSIIYLGQKTVVSAKEMILDMGVLYIKKEVLQKVFGFKINFDFHSLSANFGSEKELPLARLMKLENARENLRKAQGEELVDTTYWRNYHWFKFGMMDWSYASSQAQKYTGESRGGIGLGAEVLGGEADVWLTNSDRYRFKREQQRYYLRWVQNENSIAKQVQIGRINTTSVASLLYPMDGFMVTNAPTTVRKALGEYQIANYTQPSWLVEIYINSVLINFTRADASGYYSFKVPIVYGTSNITLRFYGPNGEEKSEEKKFDMPYTMLPKGEFEYNVIGASVIDTTHSRYARAEAKYGVTRWLCVDAGAEYLSSISTHPEMPFVKFTLQPIPKMILTGEYDHNVCAKGALNYTFLNNSVLDLNYTKYKKGQEAIIYNYLDETTGSLSVPFRINKLSGTTKASYRQDGYTNFKYNLAQLMLSAYYLNYNVSLTHYSNWVTTGASNIYSDLAVSATLGKICTLRPSVQYDYSTQSFISYKANAERKIFNQGYLSLGYERNILTDNTSFNVTLRYDFSFMSAYASSYFNDNKVQTSEGASGSFAFGSGNNYVLASRYNAVGKCGIAIEPYVDINWNNKRDANEPLVGNLNVKCNGGQIYNREKDSIVRIANLDPFVDYNITMDESGFDNLSWKISEKKIKVYTDPNQFKKISLAIHPMGEVTGMLLDNDGIGKGRILLNIYNEQGKIVANTQTESDGYFSYLGLPPGNYKVEVDSAQLKLLKMKSKKVLCTIHPSISGESEDIGKITVENLNQGAVLITSKTATKETSLKNQDGIKNKNTLEIYYLFSPKCLILNKSIFKDNDKLADAIASVMKCSPNLKIQISEWNDSSVCNLIKNKLIKNKIELSRFKIKEQTAKFKILIYNNSDNCDFRRINNLLYSSIGLDDSYYTQIGAYKVKQNITKFFNKKKKHNQSLFVVKEGSFYKIRIHIPKNSNKAFKCRP